MKDLAEKARQASIALASLSTERKNKALRRIARGLLSNGARIIAANEVDLARAEQVDLGPALRKRLRFDDEKLQASVAGVEELIKLSDPVGQTLGAMELDTGLELYKVSCPIGVLGIVFESRPDALVQISTLALKSGNAVLLKGGSEALETNRVLADIIQTESHQAGMPEGWLALLETRDDVKSMLALDQFIDLVIPRGSNAFVRYIMDHTRIPVMGHADGICHVYVDGAADMDQAVKISVDSKCQYPAVCNAMETLLVDRSVAADFLRVVQREYKSHGVELRGDPEVLRHIDAARATAEDWRTEYNDLILSIRVVDGVQSAIDHINEYGSHHTDAIVTEDEATARIFLDRVGSASVLWNCSTRFADGYRFGLGAEVGISTNKIHARGPVGLEGLVTYRWQLIGQGHIVADYSGTVARPFLHRPFGGSDRP